MSDKPQLDVETIKRLYGFGGLIAYRVAYFHDATFSVVHLPYTFDETHAREQMAELQKHFSVRMETVMVQFDRAFAIPQSEGLHD